MKDSYKQVLRVAYRISCDLNIAKEVAEKVLKKSSEQISSCDESLLGRTCKLSYMFLVKRKIRLIFGIGEDTFEIKRSDSDDKDDYHVKISLELYCRASDKMTFMQRIIFVLLVLEGLPASDVSNILGVSEHRIAQVSKQAEREIRSELRMFGRESDYPRYLEFIRQVTVPEVRS